MRPASKHINGRGQRKLIEWLTYCYNLGWSKRQMPALADLWVEHHDESGELLPQPQPGDGK